MQLSALVGIAVVAAVLCTVLKQCYPEYAAALSILTGVMLLAAVFGFITPLYDFLKRIASVSGIRSDYFAAAMKVLGLCFVTALGSDVCKDIGQLSLANKVELAGRVAVLLALLPVFEDLLVLANDLIGGSGI